MSTQLTVEQIIERYAVTSHPVKARIFLGIGYLFVVFALIGIWIPGWPTVSWAVPATFFFSLSSKKLFHWSLTNRYFGKALFDYYATGKTIPKHVKIFVCGIIILMTLVSSFTVFKLSYPVDPGYGPGTIIISGIVGVIYIALFVKTRES
jgi:uncharacterized protein